MREETTVTDGVTTMTKEEIASGKMRLRVWKGGIGWIGILIEKHNCCENTIKRALNGHSIPDTNGIVTSFKTLVNQIPESIK